MNTHKTHQKGAASAAKLNEEKLQNILQNGKLVHLRNKIVEVSYIFRDNIRKLVPVFKPIDMPNEPRIEFEGVYDIFIDDFIKIKTDVTGKFNKYELVYVYVAPILFSDDFPTDLIEDKEFGLFFSYRERNGEVSRVVSDLDFYHLMALFFGLLLTNIHLPNLFKVDEKNKIIYYEIPKHYYFNDFVKIMQLGMKLIKSSEEHKASLETTFKKLSNLLSMTIHFMLYGVIDNISKKLTTEKP